MNTSQYVPDTENRNAATMRIDEVGTIEMLSMINNEDKKIAFAVGEQLGEIAKTVKVAEKTIRDGGRVIYIGAGTSGRLGVLDASECPPTYSVPPDWIMGLIAGGEDALVRSSEGKEDIPELGVKDLQAIGFSQKDMLVGLAASGRTPYVIGAIEYARELGAKTACVVCSKDSPMESVSDISVVVDAGPEPVTGSTRMKSGTAQKMVLNMISTGTMIRLGKVYGNLMVDVRPTNSKLATRARRIIREVTGCGEEAAVSALEHSGNNVKIAIIMIKKNLSAEDAKRLLDENEGRLKQSLGEV